ncbi:sensor histidine kinase [Acrocarpospora phusangensis]|uniref:sensor histidine kinase n=1 Tax=Acrocarpospora phusangensis TaxID=1070424 RepID=UPI00195279F5|nr:sensor histidine kinase [Acrocarpospora phusangensis]
MSVRSGLAWGVFGLSCVLVAAGIVIQPGDPVDAALALGFTPLGAYLVSHRKGGAVGPLCLLAGLSAVAYAADAYGSRPDWPAADWALWIAALTWAPPLLAGCTLLLLLVPDGKLPSPRWRPVAAAAIIATTLFSAVVALIPPDTGTSPFAVEALRPLKLFFVPITGTLAAIAVLSAAGLLVRTARARGPLRLQLLWICVGAVLAVAGAFLPALVPLPGAGVPFILALPVCVAVAMLRHDLYETSLPLRRFLTFALLAVALTGLYALIARLTGSGVAGTVAVAAAVEPLHHWLRRAAGRILYGRRSDPQEVFARLARRLSGTSDPAGILAAVGDAVVEAVGPPYARIELGGHDEPLKIVERGRPEPVTLSVPLRFQGEELGAVLVSRESQGDRRVLAQLALQAGAALAAAHRAAALQRSRLLLVTAREEERRRISRDLHDGLGPVLAGIGFTVDAAGNALAADPDRTRGLLTQIRAQVHEAGAGVRGLVRGLRPPELSQLGLARAVEQSAADLRAGGLRVDVTIGDTARLTAAAEVALYFVAREALANAVRHAAPTRCAVRLRPARKGFEIMVTDDGPGLPPDARPGVGLTSMRERVEELDGTFTVESGPAGTVVRAWLPA